MDWDKEVTLDETIFNNLKSSMGEVFDEIKFCFFEESKSLVLDIENKFKESLFEDISFSSHALKSSSKTFGAMKLSAICEDLEYLKDRNSERAVIEKLVFNLSKEYDSVVSEIERIN